MDVIVDDKAGKIALIVADKLPVEPGSNKVVKHLKPEKQFVSVSTLHSKEALKLIIQK